MPTTRTRRARPSNLSPAAAAWIDTDEATDFFTNPNYQMDDWYGPFKGMPGLRPWWPPLDDVWKEHKFGQRLCEYSRDDVYQAALNFLLTMYEEWKRRRVRWPLDLETKTTKENFDADKRTLKGS